MTRFYNAWDCKVSPFQDVGKLLAGFPLSHIVVPDRGSCFCIETLFCAEKTCGSRQTHSQDSVRVDRAGSSGSPPVLGHSSVASEIGWLQWLRGAADPT